MAWGVGSSVPPSMEGRGGSCEGLKTLSSRTWGRGPPTACAHVTVSSAYALRPRPPSEWEGLRGSEE